MDRVAELLNRADEGFNEVTISKCEGGVSILLSHRASFDNATEVFVPSDRILFHHLPEDEAALDHLNKGGEWSDLDG